MLHFIVYYSFKLLRVRRPLMYADLSSCFCLWAESSRRLRMKITHIQHIQKRRLLSDASERKHFWAEKCAVRRENTKWNVTLKTVIYIGNALRIFLAIPVPFKHLLVALLGLFWRTHTSAWCNSMEWELLKRLNKPRCIWTTNIIPYEFTEMYSKRSICYNEWYFKILKYCKYNILFWTIACICGLLFVHLCIWKK